MTDESGAEASEAGAIRPAHARVDDAERARRLQPLGQRLRMHVAVGVQTVAKRALAPQVMKLAAEVGKIVIEGHFILEAADLGELDGLVEGDFSLGGLQLEGGVPGTALGTVEPPPERVGMREGGIDDAVVRHAENELVHADAGQPVVLGEQPVVGGVVEVENFSQMRIVVRNAGEDARAAIAVFRRDQPMGVVAPDERDRRKLTFRRLGQKPPRRASSSRRTVCMAGTPPFSMKASGVAPRKMRLVLGSRTHSSASRSECRMLRALKMPTR